MGVVEPKTKKPRSAARLMNEIQAIKNPLLAGFWIQRVASIVGNPS
jgi:hypothetical protein